MINYSMAVYSAVGLLLSLTVLNIWIVAAKAVTKVEYTKRDHKKFVKLLKHRRRQATIGLTALWMCFALVVTVLNPVRHAGQQQVVGDGYTPLDEVQTSVESPTTETIEEVNEGSSDSYEQFLKENK